MHRILVTAAAAIAAAVIVPSAAQGVTLHQDGRARTGSCRKTRSARTNLAATASLHTLA